MSDPDNGELWRMHAKQLERELNESGRADFHDLASALTWLDCALDMVKRQGSEHPATAYEKQMLETNLTQFKQSQIRKYAIL